MNLVIDNDLAKRSPLYKEYTAKREEIFKHQATLSDSRDKEVCFDEALFDWMLHHRAAWKASRRKQSQS